MVCGSDRFRRYPDPGRAMGLALGRSVEQVVFSSFGRMGGWNAGEQLDEPVRRLFQGPTRSGQSMNQQLPRLFKQQPYCFEVNDGELFAFAGLWERWKDPSGKILETCSILTTTPNAVTSAVHDRMPVMLEPDCYDLWLDPGMTNVDAVSDMLKPFDARLMRSFPVSARVNHVSNDDAACSTPVEIAQTQARLF